MKLTVLIILHISTRHYSTQPTTRLRELHPSKDTGAVNVRLVNTNLDPFHAPNYSVSYAWGPENLTTLSAW